MIATSTRLAAVFVVASCWGCGAGPGSEGEPAVRALALPGGSADRPVITFLEFGPPALAQPPAGPENDVTGRAGVVRFRVTDPGCDAGHPPVVTCSGTTGVGCDCALAGGATWLCQHTYDLPASPADGAPLLQESLTVTAANPSHGSATATLHWQVDALAPSLLFSATVFRGDGATPQNACTQGLLAVTLGTGEVHFTSSDRHGSGTTFRCTLASAGGATVLDEAACSARISESAAGATAYRFAFAGLPDGASSLVLTATDALGNAASAAFSWVVDATPPGVTYVSPADPGTGPHDIVAPDVNPTGTFTATPDASDQPVAFQCNPDGGVGGASQACSPGSGYSLAGLSEGAHLIQISATDCVGNAAVAPAIPFDVDLNPPDVMITTLGAAPDPLGTLTLAVIAQDAITNVEALACVLDDELAVPSLPCPGLVSAGSALPTPEHVLAFAGTTTLTQLSPGEHVLRYRALDRWGHASLVRSLSFLAAYPGSAGGVVVIGQDYASIEAGGGGSGGLVSTTPSEKLLGNAAFLAKAAGFDRPIHAVLMDFGTVAPDLEVQSTHLMEAMCRRVAERQADLGRSCSCDSTAADACLSFTQVATSPGQATAGQLGLALRGADLLVFPDQDGVDGSALTALGSSAPWEVLLRIFVNSGGVVIVTSGTDSGGTPTSTFQLVSGLVSLALADQGSDATSQAFLECHSRDPLAFSLTTLDDTNGGLFDWPERYVEPANAVRFMNLDALPAVAGEVKDTNEIYESEGTACATDCQTFPVVLHGYFPRRPDVGPLHVVATEIASDGTSRQLRRRSRGDSALFQRPGDTEADVAFCPLHGDGTISHEIAAGSIVTIARGTAADPGDPSRPSSSPGLESLYGVHPGDVVLIGLSSYQDPAGDAPVSVSLPAYPGAHHYRVSSGCQEVAVPDPGGGTTVTLSIALGERCSTFDPVHPYFLVAAAADANDTVLAFDTAAVEPPQGTSLAPVWRGWISAPLRLIVQSDPAFDPTTDPFVEQASVAVALAHQGLLLDEAVPPDESSLPWAPRFPSLLASPGDGGVRAELRLGFRPFVAGGSTDESAYRVSEPPPGADQILAVSPAQFLPRVSGITSAGTPGVDGSVFWSVDARLWAGADATLDVVDADGEAVLQAVEMTGGAGVTCPATARWLLMATPGEAPRTTLDLPLIPAAALACRPAATTGAMVSFFSGSATARAATHRAFADQLPDPMKVLAYGGAGVMAPPRRFAAPGTVERYTSSSQFAGGGSPVAPPPPPGGAGAAGGSGCGAPGTAPSALLLLALAALRVARRRPAPIESRER